MEMKHVLCIAHSCCDLVFGGLPKLPAPGQEIYGSHFSVQTGGGANTPVLLARSGVPTAFWTMLGDDFAGRTIRETLIKHGVILVEHGQHTVATPVSAVLSTKEDRAFASYTGPEELIGSIGALEDAIKNADIVHTCPGYCVDYPIPALCEKHGRLLSLDSNFCDAAPDLFGSVLPHCDYWKGNEEEACRMTGSENAEAALLRICGQVRRGAVVTLGDKGSIGAEKNGAVIRQPAIESGPFLDACGAGDAFAAGMLSGIARDESFSDCLRRGAALAGLVVTAYGGCPETIEISHE